MTPPSGPGSSVPPRSQWMAAPTLHTPCRKRDRPFVSRPGDDGVPGSRMRKWIRPLSGGPLLRSVLLRSCRQGGQHPRRRHYLQVHSQRCGRRERWPSAPNPWTPTFLLRLLTPAAPAPSTRRKTMKRDVNQVTERPARRTCSAVVSLINPEDISSIRSFCNQVHFLSSPKSRSQVREPPGRFVDPRRRGLPAHLGHGRTSAHPCSRTQHRDAGQSDTAFPQPWFRTSK